MSEVPRKVSYLYYNIDQIILDAERCLECQQQETCVNRCAKGLEIPRAMAAIAHRAFVVRDGLREELEEAVAEAYAREAVHEYFSYW